MFKPAFLAATIAIAPLATTAVQASSDGAAHAPAAWASMDANSDGVLTEDEVASTPWEDRFEQIDANHDGKATKQEYAADMKAMKKSQKKRDSNEN